MSEIDQSPIKNLYYKSGHINYESPAVIITCFFMWRLSYFICETLIFPNQSPEFSARVQSSIHGVIAAFLGINQCFVPDWPYEHPEWKTTYMQSFILAFSCGYFLHDFIWMLKYDTKDKVMLGHHVYCIMVCILLLNKGYSGGQVTCGLGSMELTNPFLQARWFLRTAGMKDTPIFVSTEITFFAVFMLVRIVLGTYFLKVILEQPKNDWDIKAGFLGIYIISWFFVFDMIRYIVVKKLKKGTTTTATTNTVNNENKNE